MPKQREKNSNEFYQGKIRELNKYIRSLEKRVKELEKHLQPQDVEYSSDQEDTHPNLTKTCSVCGKGKIKTIDIVGRVFEVCDVCDYRKKVGDHGRS